MEDAIQFNYSFTTYNTSRISIHPAAGAICRMISGRHDERGLKIKLMHLIDNFLFGQLRTDYT